jgi:hypothetical protein
VRWQTETHLYVCDAQPRSKQSTSAITRGVMRAEGWAIALRNAAAQLAQKRVFPSFARNYNRKDALGNVVRAKTRFRDARMPAVLRTWGTPRTPAVRV